MKSRRALGVESVGWVWAEGQTREKRNLFKRYLHYCVRGHDVVLFITDLVSTGLIFFFSFPCFLSIRWASFIEVFRSEGAASAWCWLGYWGFDLWQHHVTAPCHPFIFNLALQYEWRQSRAGEINEGACQEFSSRASSLDKEERLGWCEILWSHNSFIFGRCSLFISIDVIPYYSVMREKSSERSSQN